MTKIDWLKWSVTNYTMPDHILFEGKVIRRIVKRNNQLFLVTTGSGNNKSATIRYLNNSQTTMKILWTAVDEKLKAEIQKRTRPFSGQWTWLPCAQAPADVIEKLKTYKEWEGKTAYDNLLQNVKNGCKLQVALLDLDLDGKPGIAVRSVGGTCCNFKRECPITVFEADGYKRVYLQDDKLSLVKPANNGIISSTGAFFEFQDFTQLMNYTK